MAMEIVYLVLALLISILLLKKLSNKKQPPSPLALPIIGHLHLLRYPLHRTLESLSYKYGPILFLRFGSLPVLVVSSLSAVEQCFTQNDTIFANRPNLIAGELLGYNYTNLVWAPYGDHWRNLRRVSAIHIFSANSIQASAYIRNEEIRFLVGKLFRESGGGARKVNLKSVFFRLMYDVLTKLITGTRRSIPEQMFGASNFMNMSDYFPVLKWVGKGLQKKMKKLNEERDGFVQGLIDECRRERASSSLPGKKTAKTGRRRTTVVETFLSLQEAEPEFYSDDIIKGMLMVLFIAGTDTSARTMEWAMSILFNHPEVLQKAKSEIENNIDKGHLINDSDLTKLPYLQCIVKETLRLFPIAPLLVPHFSSEECTIGEFKVPPGTTLLVNAWAIHKNPDVWKEPNKFKPERFEGVEREKEGFKFLTFGVGRRSCPGAALALRTVGLALGALIQCFEWERDGPGLVDLAEGGGITVSKVKPLEATYYPCHTMINVLSQL